MGRGYLCKGSRLWNALPVNVRAEEDIDNYKKMVKTILFNGYEELKRKAYKYDLQNG